MTPNQFKILMLVEQGRNDPEALAGYVDQSEIEALIQDGFLETDKGATLSMFAPGPVYKLTRIGKMAITPLKD